MTINWPNENITVVTKDFYFILALLIVSKVKFKYFNQQQNNMDNDLVIGVIFVVVLPGCVLVLVCIGIGIITKGLMRKMRNRRRSTDPENPAEEEGRNDEVLENIADPETDPEITIEGETENSEVIENTTNPELMMERFIKEREKSIKDREASLECPETMKNNERATGCDENGSLKFFVSFILLFC